jgi:hypothetical protein
MTTLLVIPDFDVLKHLRACHIARGEPVAVHQLLLERSEETLHHVHARVNRGIVHRRMAGERSALNNSEFVAFVAPRDLHNGQVLRVEQNQDRVTVCVQGDTGRRFALEFSNVAELTAVKPEGMVLYALAEFAASAPLLLRRFIFANWHDDDNVMLEVVAQSFRPLEGSEAGERGAA